MERDPTEMPVRVTCETVDVCPATLPPHLSRQPLRFHGFESYSHRNAVQLLDKGAETCSPRPPARIFSIPPAPSARHLHHFHPRLYEFWASLDSFSEAAEGLLEVS